MRLSNNVKDLSTRDIEILQIDYPYVDCEIYLGPLENGEEWKLHRCFVFDPEGHNGSKRKPFFYSGEVFKAKNSEDVFNGVCSLNDKRVRTLVPLKVRNEFKKLIPCADKLMKKQLQLYLKSKHKHEILPAL